MSLERQIAESFAATRPAETARVLQTLSEDAVQELLDACDVEVAAGVVGAMAPLFASRYLTRTTESRAGELLGAVPFECGADLLRRLEANERARVLSPLASERRRHLEKLLRYPEHTAGALMEPRVASFHLKQTVDEVVGDVRRRGSEIRFYVFVTDEDQVLRGVLSLRELAVAARDASLESIMVSPVEHLLARAHASAILAHPAWRRLPLLPVVGDSGRLVGVFRYETLRALEGHLADEQESSPLGVTLALGELFWFGASGLIRGWESSEDE